MQTPRRKALPQPMVVLVKGVFNFHVCFVKANQVDVDTVQQVDDGILNWGW